jgi:hypothetical protein
MDIHMLETAVRSAGVLPTAVEDAVRRLEGHFAQMADPSAAIIAERLTALRTAAPHLFPPQPTVDTAGVPVGVPPEVWKGLSPSSKLSYAREHGYGLPPPERRRPPLPLTAEQASVLATLQPAARLDAYRELQRQAQQQG